MWPEPLPFRLLQGVLRFDSHEYSISKLPPIHQRHNTSGFSRREFSLRVPPLLDVVASDPGTFVFPKLLIWRAKSSINVAI